MHVRIRHTSILGLRTNKATLRHCKTWFEIRQSVVGGMPGGLPLQFRHYTRTLEFGPEGSFFMSIGSRQTDGVDDGPWRSLVKRFSPAVVAGFGDGREPFPWQRGQTWALGLRNEVGIRFDSAGVLWGVEIGQNLVVDADLGGDLTADNPCTCEGRGGRAGQGAQGDLQAEARGTLNRAPTWGVVQCLGVEGSGLLGRLCSALAPKTDRVSCAATLCGGHGRRVTIFCGAPHNTMYSLSRRFSPHW